MMEEWIRLLQEHQEIVEKAAAVFIGLLGIVLLSRILRQMKQLNKSLGKITGSVQAYFDVIMQEDAGQEEKRGREDETARAMEERREPEAEKERERRESEVRKEQERRESEAREEQKRREDENLFNAVLQEYFS